MNLRQLEYFVAIAEERQITAAARRLNISQPPLSYELGKLEKELGAQLVVRGPRSVEPSCSGLMPGSKLLDLRQRFPEVEFEVREGTTPEVCELLEGGIVDIGIVRTPFKSDGLRCRYAPSEPLVAVMPPASEVGQEATCTAEDLSGLDLIASARLVPELRKVFEIGGHKLKLCCQTDDPRTAALWAREGMGCALVPRSLICVTDTGDQFIKVVDCRELESRAAVIWKAQHVPTPLFQHVIAALGDLS